jgi:hypothetical protein
MDAIQSPATRLAARIVSGTRCRAAGPAIAVVTDSCPAERGIGRESC